MKNWLKYNILAALIVGTVMMCGCMSMGPDPIVGHWGAVPGNMGIYLSLDAYSNGTATWTASSMLVGSMSVLAKWEKNPNGTYTLFTEEPSLITISGNNLIMGNTTDNLTLMRDFTYSSPSGAPLSSFQTVAPVLITTTPTTAPQTSSTESASVQEGTLVITIPPAGDKVDYEPISIDGNVVGTATSVGPTTISLLVGQHSLAVGTYATRLIDIEFAKTNNQMFALTGPGGISSEAAGAAASGANIVTNNIEGPRSFTGSGDSVQQFGVAEGGYIFSATYRGDENFIVHITDTSGNTIEYLFNEIGPYSGSKIVNLPAGQYYLQIQASGPFAIDMSQS